MCPVSLMLAYYLDRQKKTKPEEHVKKITYINFVGFYPELDIDFLRQTSTAIQMICIYDKETQNYPLPKVPNENSDPQQNSEFEKNLLLLPLSSSEGKIDSHYIESLFERIVEKALEKFGPDLIIISHSFLFSPWQNNSLLFNLDVDSWSRILYRLCLKVNYKVIVFLHKPTLELPVSSLYNSFLTNVMKPYSKN
jgi:hypothetical protein